MKISAKEMLNILNIGYTRETFRSIINNISEVLTKIGFEVDSLTFEDEALKGFVIARVEECKKHPESAKLSICKVNTGTETLQVLCGAPNVHSNMNVILATQGAVIPKNGLVIQKTKLAGYESQGMICSADELGTGANDGSIIEIEHTVTVGTPYFEYIKKDDAVIDIAITPNRGDALSYLGLARELVAQGIGSVTIPSLTQETAKPKQFEVEILEENLVNSVFFGRLNSIAFTPKIQDILVKCGISSTKIPVVDALNYITEIYGQPMHICDGAKIKGSIRIRKSIEGEKLITLSKQEITLTGGDIVIVDEEKIISLGGIIGDSRSAVSNETKDFILESCSFNRDLIFKTIRKYNIHTSASFRFERYVDSGNARIFPQKIYAQKFAELVQSNFTHTFEMQSKENPHVIICSTSAISKTLGFSVEFPKIVDTLSRLSFECNGDIENFKVTVPSFRKADIKQVNDITEEIIRSIGLEACPRKNLEIVQSSEQYTMFKIKELLSRNLHEIITFPFVSEKDFSLFDDIANAVKLVNSLNEETPYMRSSLIPSMLHNIAKAESLSHMSSSIFEIAKVFVQTKEQAEICIAKSGINPIHTPLQKPIEYTIFDVKEEVLSIIEDIYGLKRESVVYKNILHKAFHPHQAFDMMIGRNTIATLAQIHPLATEDYSIRSKVFIGKIYLGNIPLKTQKSSVKSGYKPEALPSVARELSIVVRDEVTCLDILRSLQKITKNRFTATVTDIFQNDSLKASGKKSILLSFELFQHEKTLNSEEIEGIISESMETLRESVGAILRGDA